MGGLNTIYSSTNKLGYHKKRKQIFKINLGLYALFAPAFLFMFVFQYIPIYGVSIAFMNYSPYRGFFGSEWVGFSHFRYFFSDPKFWFVMKNTVILSIYDLIFHASSTILFALLLNEIMNRKFKRVVQTISYLPNFLSWVVVGGLVKSVLSPSTGIINTVLVRLFNIEPIFFMTIPGIFRGILVISSIWKGIGWGSILYLSIIASIDSQLYEAAYIDGAGRLKQTWHITLPGMRPMITLLLLLSVTGLFSVGFDRVFNLHNPLVYSVSEVLSIYTFRIGIVGGRYGLSTAISLTQSVLGLILLTSANWISGKVAGIGLY